LLLDDDVLMNGVVKNSGQFNVALFIADTGELVLLPPGGRIILYRSCGVTCQAGYYACCSSLPTACVCVQNGQQSQHPCIAGGPGSSGCSIENP
jgi:hypothetical protein